MKRHWILSVVCLLMLALPIRVWAQKHSLRVEASSLLVGHIGLDYGIAVSPKVSVHVPVFVKPVTLGIPAPVGAVMSFERLFSEHLYLAGQFSPVEHWTHAGIEPGVRYWTNGVYNRGVFFGGHILGKVFRYGGHRLDSSFREGYAVGGFASIGYSRELSARWGLELELGLGVQYRSYDRYDLSRVHLASGEDLVPAVSRFGIQIVYLL